VTATLGALVIAVIVAAIGYVWWSAIRAFKRKRKEWAAIDRMKKRPRR
jgi:hypothetical protein